MSATVVRKKNQTTLPADVLAAAGIHDLLPARAALKSGAKTLLTLDRNDFAKLVPGLSIEQI